MQPIVQSTSLTLATITISYDDMERDDITQDMGEVPKFAADDKDIPQSV